MTRQERNRQIVEWIKAGEPTKAVARKFKMTSVNVRTICRKAGIRKYKQRHDRSAKQKRNEEIVPRVKAGEAMADIAAEFGLNRGYVRDICWRAGISMQEKVQRERKERNAEIVHRVHAGETCTAVAREFGLSAGSVSHICREAGVSLHARSKEQTQARNAEIVRRVKAGESLTDTAKAFGLKPVYIEFICRNAGVNGWGLRRNRNRERNQHRERDADIVRRIKDGESQASIAREFGLKPHTVQHICRKAGIRPRARLNDKEQLQTRNAEIVRRVKAGETKTAVAKAFELKPLYIGFICREAAKAEEDG